MLAFLNQGIGRSVFGEPKKVRNTDVGKGLQRFFTGSNMVPGGGSVPAPAVQNKPLASGSIQFGGEQRNRNLLNIVALAVVAILGYRFLGKNGKRRRR